MKIIGHRGAAGIKLENTLEGIEFARHCGVYRVEIDVRKTADNQLVVCHDADLSRVSNKDYIIHKTTLKKIKSVTLNNGSSFVPTLSEALKAAKSTGVLIEIKDKDCSKELMETLKAFPENKVEVASFDWAEMKKLRTIDDALKLVLLDHTKPFDVVKTAKKLGMNGVGLNFWLMNPLTYLLCKFYGLSMYVYTVNNKFLVSLLSIFYPGVAICTDRPERFTKN